MDRLTDLASAAVGGRALFATDEFFAAAHRLLLPAEPEFLADEFTTFGKWMDGWETRRKRVPGHDWCLLQLGLRGNVEAIEVDTAFFTGNHTPRVSVQAACFPASELPPPLQQMTDAATSERAMGVSASAEELKIAEQLRSHKWTELVPMTGACTASSLRAPFVADSCFLTVRAQAWIP